MKLSKNFSLWELTRSQSASRKGIPNVPNGEIVTALKKLCVNVLQPIRDRFGVVNVSSGYRSPAVNQAIGGSLRSQHMSGEAADIEIFGTSNLEVARWIRDSSLEFDELILEFHTPRDGPNSGWIHVSHTGGTNRRRVLTATRTSGVMKFVRGLP